MASHEILNIPANDLIQIATITSLAMAGFTRRQRKVILVRDEHTCQMNCQLTRFCGGPDDRVDVHHIRSQSYCREQGLNPNKPDNGITLCRTYHNSLHPAESSALRGDEPNWRTDDDHLLQKTVLDNNKIRLYGGKTRVPKKRNRRLTLRIFGGSKEGL